MGFYRQKNMFINYIFNIIIKIQTIYPFLRLRIKQSELNFYKISSVIKYV